MTYIIGEIGLNSNGNLAAAKQLMTIAAIAGCDAVKFQKRTNEICFPPEILQTTKKTPWGTLPYLEYRNKLEFNANDYNEIDDLSVELGIDWSASVWDLPSAEFMFGYDVPWIKIPSAKLTDLELISTVGDWAKRNDKKIILSTGMSTIEEIGNAYMSLPRSTKTVWMHCHSGYPSPVEELNLNRIKTLQLQFPDDEIGWSGHEFGLGTTFAAVGMGATHIERHITLDREMWGSDQTSSVEPVGLFKLVKGIRDIDKAMGDGEIRVMPGEMEAKKKLRI